MKDKLIAAHEFCTNNKTSLKRDKKCGCFHCMKIYDPIEIKDWITDADGTAICPYCGIDSVLGESSGYPITEDFLSEMNDYWFRIVQFANPQNL